MPGILPMKMIKIGAGTYDRIAQACDRCRSKKIKCDGARPCCTQCASVGFECKTSDKLSRRAFPRGYTESLEERVRALETEVRELKDLLDEKDEKLDMLSKISPQRALASNRLPTPRRSDSVPASPADEAVDKAGDDDVTFKVDQPSLSADANQELSYVGVSSAAYFLGWYANNTLEGNADVGEDSLKQRAQGKGKFPLDVDPTRLLPSAASRRFQSSSCTHTTITPYAPARLLTDQLVNVYFQEWAPLFPILHRPTFLSLYHDYISNSEDIDSQASIAQLHLVFNLAALSTNAQHASEVSNFEQQWVPALREIQDEQSFPVLQCLLLAQLICIQRGDCARLLTYKSLASPISTKLGLHRSQKQGPAGTLTCESRKRVFWTLYTIDGFSAVMLGMPKHIRDAEVYCEYPTDVDDEYITEDGCEPLLPGDFTKVSSALALFRATRILSKVLDAVYPDLPSYSVSMRRLSALESELGDWHASLPTHLRLPFAQDKPTVGTVSSRSPLLALTYHYIRALIHRSAVCASVDNSTSMLAMAGSCKHTAQILALLTERGLSFSFCLNKEELLVCSGIGLLMQSLELPRHSKVLRDNQKVTMSIVGQLHKMTAPSAPAFRKLACALLPMPSDHPANKSTPRHVSDGSMPAPRNTTIPAVMKEQFKAMTQKVSWLGKNHSAQRRAIHGSVYQDPAFSQSQPVISSSDARMARSEPAHSPELAAPIATPGSHASPTVSTESPPTTDSHRHSLNLDYTQWPQHAISQSVQYPPTSREASEWQRLLGMIDNGQTNIYDNIYGGPAVEALGMSRHSTTSLPQKLALHNDPNALRGTHNEPDGVTWSPELWAVTGADVAASNMAPPTLTESVFSLSSGDEACAGPMLFDDSASGHAELEQFGGILLPDFEHDDALAFWGSAVPDFTVA